MSAKPGSHDYHVPESGAHESWHKITDVPGFLKWQYRNTPYRVVAMSTERGHWKVVFTSWYGGDSYTIAGNLGGGKDGRLRAVGKAAEFFAENKTGCKPPSQYE